MRIAGTILAVLFFSTALSAQSIQLNGFFRPSVDMFTLVTPATKFADSLTFQDTRYSFSATIPLEAKVQPKLKSLVRARFLLLNGGYQTVRAGFDGEPVQVWNASIGMAGGKVSLLRGAWVYAWSAGVYQAFGTNNIRPNFVGAVAKLRIKGLRRHRLYGAGVIAGRNFILPFPIIGFSKIKNLKRGWVALFPFYYRTWWKPSNGTRLIGELEFSGFNSATNNRFPIFEPVEQSSSSINVLSGRAGLRFQARVTSNFWVEAGGGADVMKRVVINGAMNARFEDWIPIQPFIQGGIKLKLNSAWEKGNLPLL